VDGKAVNGIQNLVEVLAKYDPDDVVKMTLIRDGKSTELNVTLAEKPAN